VVCVCVHVCVCVQVHASPMNAMRRHMPKLPID
jgi:hypothetical protein